MPLQKQTRKQKKIYFTMKTTKITSFKGQSLPNISFQQFMKSLPVYTEVKTLDFVVKISNSTV
jgi:hypothetical protein